MPSFLDNSVRDAMNPKVTISIMHIITLYAHDCLLYVLYSYYKVIELMADKTQDGNTCTLNMLHYLALYVVHLLIALITID